jgi:hypothetical protein|tara:strand:+ start:7735 stop:7974 length:240 start_codon:yes stop_codon:yes gene_type:complete
MAQRNPLIYNDNAGQLQEVSVDDQINVGIVSAVAFSNVQTVVSPVSLANTSYNYAMFGPIAVSGVGTISVATGVTYAVL